MPRPAAVAAPAALLVLLITPAAARVADAAALDGAALGPAWAVPFAGVLLSIALMPILAERFWHRHYGKVAAFWGVLTMAALLAKAGGAGAAEILLHTVAQEYLPFVLLLTALYTVTGGMRLEGPFTGTPASNTALLAAGTALASVTGTTGAAMLLIRPVVRANAWRHRRRHTIVFFVFLVANIGGSLTPLGDPPLFLGFLKGVPFFWPTLHLLGPMLLCSAVLLAVHHLIDASLVRKEGPPPPPAARRLRLEGGGPNLPLLAAVLLAVLLSGVWDGGIAFAVPGAVVTWQALLRDLALLATIAASLALTPAETRRANDFSWGPMLEVAKLFAAIFVTIVPVIAMLRAGREGVFAPIVDLATGPAGEPVDAVYFWATGLLSSFLDNAPTYLVFFNLAGGDAAQLTAALPATLAAISAGAVFMGANTYIGNAPNFMVRAVAEDMGVRMPSFFAYTLWSGAVLLPLFALVTVVFFL
jgi:Na+/H+ antiporter NhaD/arsenite permease-like protein